MNCCSSRCGHCGRCDDGRERVDQPEYDFCDECRGDIIPGVTRNITLAGLGKFCSVRCADRASETHATVLQRRSA